MNSILISTGVWVGSVVIGLYLLYRIVQQFKREVLEECPESDEVLDPRDEMTDAQ